jgi:hypothetical protein
VHTYPHCIHAHSVDTWIIACIHTYLCILHTYILTSDVFVNTCMCRSQERQATNPWIAKTAGWDEHDLLSWSFAARRPDRQASPQ